MPVYNTHIMLQYYKAHILWVTFLIYFTMVMLREFIFLLSLARSRRFYVDMFHFALGNVNIYHIFSHLGPSTSLI